MTILSPIPLLQLATMPHAISPVGDRPLDFHDVGELNEQSRRQAIDALGPILVSAFSNLHPSWSAPIHKPDYELREALQEWRQAVIDPVLGSRAIAERYFEFITGMAEYCFSTVTLEQRLLICKINGIGVIVDDQIPHNHELRAEAETYLRKLTTGRPINSPLLKNFGNLIRDHADTNSDPAVADYQWWSWLGFLVGTAFETRTENILQALKQPLIQQGGNGKQFASSELPYFVRVKSGVSEAWILCLFSQHGDHSIPMDMWLPILPDLMLFMNLVNDLLSAPKEILKGETTTYLNYQTYAKRQVGTPGSGSDGGWCFEDSYIEACDSLVHVIARIDSMVSQRLQLELEIDQTSQNARDAEFVQDCWSTYKAGILEMHFDTKRYNAKTWFPALERLRSEHRETLAQL